MLRSEQQGEPARILLVGAGQIGSRHLQALARLEIPGLITVIDPDAAAREVARARFAEVSTGNRPQEVAYLSGLDDAPSSFDVAIVATASKPRRAIVETLLSRVTVRDLILEKVLFPDAPAYPAVGERLTRTGTRGWVNCARRQWPIYADLQVPRDRPLRIEVRGNGWGLGSNGIHFLDLACFFTRDSDWSVADCALDAASPASKRPGYCEFTGVLELTTPAGHALLLDSRVAEPHQRRVTLIAGDWRAELDEPGGRGTIAGKDVTFSYPPQSALTQHVVQALIGAGTCPLPSYPVSAKLHLAFLAPLLEHHRRTTDAGATGVPIT